MRIWCPWKDENINDAKKRPKRTNITIIKMLTKYLNTCQPSEKRWNSFKAQVVMMKVKDNGGNGENDKNLRIGTGVEVSRSASENCPTATPTRHNTKPWNMIMMMDNHNDDNDDHDYHCSISLYKMIPTRRSTRPWNRLVGICIEPGKIQVDHVKIWRLFSILPNYIFVKLL